MEKETKDLGFIIVGEDDTKRELKRVSMMTMKGLDDRNTVIAELEDGSFELRVINPLVTGRGNAKMLLSKESLLMLLTLSSVFLDKRGISVEKELEAALGPNPQLFSSEVE